MAEKRKPIAVQPIELIDLKIDDLRRELESGDSDAADRAVLWCKMYRRPFPTWLIDELAIRADENLGFIDRRPRKLRGRHSNYAVKRAEKNRHYALVVAVNLCRGRHGLKGDDVFETATEALRRGRQKKHYDDPELNTLVRSFFQHHEDAESVRSLYQKHKNKVPQPEAVFFDFIEMTLDEIICDILGRSYGPPL